MARCVTGVAGEMDDWGASVKAPEFNAIRLPGGGQGPGAGAATTDAAGDRLPQTGGRHGRVTHLVGGVELLFMTLQVPLFEWVAAVVRYRETHPEGFFAKMRLPDGRGDSMIRAPLCKRLNFNPIPLPAMVQGMPRRGKAMRGATGLRIGSS